eukprot:Awhi_evm1s14512
MRGIHINAWQIENYPNILPKALIERGFDRNEYKGGFMQLKCKLSEEQFFSLIDVIKTNRSLVLLDLKRTRLTPSCIAYLADALKENKSIRILHLENTLLATEQQRGVEVFARFLQDYNHFQSLIKISFVAHEKNELLDSVLIENQRYLTKLYFKEFLRFEELYALSNLADQGAQRSLFHMVGPHAKQIKQSVREARNEEPFIFIKAKKKYRVKKSRRVNHNSLRCPWHMIDILENTSEEMTRLYVPSILKFLLDNSKFNIQKNSKSNIANANVTVENNNQCYRARESKNVQLLPYAIITKIARQLNLHQISKFVDFLPHSKENIV